VTTTCCFCGATIFLDDFADVAACYGCLDERGLPRSGAGLIAYLEGYGVRL
jgi:hypothetical protein